MSTSPSAISTVKLPPCSTPSDPQRQEWEFFECRSFGLCPIWSSPQPYLQRNLCPPRGAGALSFSSGPLSPYPSSSRSDLCPLCRSVSGPSLWILEGLLIFLTVSLLRPSTSSLSFPLGWFPEVRPRHSPVYMHNLLRTGATPPR